uniref:tryptophan--tRNA ligase n=1 Tax=Heterosigma akashiwo TaxID=2829 RepID=A0A6V1Q501_HETAK|mmetsp:Transcript_17260/g.26065  ORF Transcript_17260/g.26065 Transcript_17260/m.26065 type:complete len:412 (+) Transcript_17260:110-1345(+)|eukprot:CAMPEP_0194724848 /NCGR_PEP_ID=MMETSP0296-20130528/23586_1 /TAXON_ID=39354 /ORGANISM="Heterosigma akashiwo, Strain CCMP2393" /LENGTH=411 /DNA_ID=CAMNT_0039629029 /DNA_START=94 /DNA_END=1329 /DNA_ORIENTATION=-
MVALKQVPLASVLLILMMGAISKLCCGFSQAQRKVLARGTSLSTAGVRSVLYSSVPASEEAAKPETEIKVERKKRVLSGVQPTGSLHLGNYLGAIRQWVKNQDEYENFFCVVDLHAITAPHDPKELKKSTLQSAALYLAAGIDPAKSNIFVQSHVTAHAELAWLLNCVTPMNWLERMIQFKEKARKQGENVGVGLFDYPVLMAADILLYQTDCVPVGEDQRQHLELTRDIAGRFNDQFVKRKMRPVFKQPTPLIAEEGARVMSLQDGTSKMSKSAENDNSRINLNDSPEVIRRKIKKCKTDQFQGMEWDNPERPECTNLLTIYQACTGKSKEAVLAEVGEMNWGAFKPVLADAVVDHLAPIQARYAELMADPTHLNRVLREGAAAADEVAQQTLLWTKNAMGFTTLEDLEP